MTTLLIRCEACKGAKKLLGLGNIPIKCPVCKGVGCCESLDIADLQVNDDVGDLNVVPIKDIVTQDPKELKKIAQSEKMKESWAKRKAATGAAT